MRRVGRIAVCVVAGLAGLAAIGFGALQTDMGRTRFATVLERAFTTPRSAIRIGKIAGFVPFDMRITRIELADAGETWLSIDGLALTWSPASLLRGRLRIDHLTAGAVTILRRPSPSASADTKPFSLPFFPLAIDLHDLTIRRLMLASAVTGGDNAEAAVSARGLLEHDRANLTVGLARTDGQPGRAEVDAGYDRLADTLRLKLDVDEPTGTLLDTAMERNDHLPVRVALAGDGPLSGWRGKFDLASSGGVHGEATIEFAHTTGTRFAITGAIAPGPLLADNLRPLVGDTVGFDIVAAEDGSGGVMLAPSRITLGAVTLEAEGRKSDAGSLTGKARVSASDLAAAAPLVGYPTRGALTIDLLLTGTTERPKMTLQQRGQLMFGDIAVDGLTVDATVTGKRGTTEQNPLFDITADAKAGALRDTGSGRNYGPLDIHFVGVTDAQGTLVDVAELVATGGGIELQGGGGLKRGETVGKATLVASDLSVLGKMLEQPIGGATTVNLDIRTSGDRAVALNLTGTGDRLRTGTPAIDALVAGTVRLELQGTRAADGQITLSKFAVATPGMNVSADGRFNPADRAMVGRLSAKLNDLKPLSSALSSSLTGTGELLATIGGTLDIPSIDADASLDHLMFGAARIDHFDAKIRTLNGLNGTVSVEGRLNTGKLVETFDAAVSRETRAGGAATYRLSPLRLAGTGGTVDASLIFDSSRNRIGGKLDTLIPDLSVWAGVVGEPVAGQFSLALDLPVDGARPGPVKASIDHFSLGAIPHSIGIRHANLTGNLSGNLARQNGILDLTLADLSAGGGSITTADIHVGAKGDNTDFRVRATGRFYDPISFEMAGTAVAEKDVSTLSVLKFSGKIGRDSLSLTKPATLSIASEAYRLAGLALNVNGGTIEGAASLSPKVASADISVRRLPLHPLAFLVGQAYVGGTLDGKFVLSGTPQRPAVRINVTTTGLDLETDGPLPRPNLNLTAQVDWRDERANLGVKISTGTGDALELAGSAPFAFDLVNLKSGVPRDAGLNLSIAGGGRLENLTSIVPLGEDRVTGAFKVDVTVRGTLTDPKPGGRITVTGGHYANLALGTELDGIDLSVSGEGERFKLDSLTATDGKSGTLRAFGAADVGVSPAAIDLSLGFKDFMVARGDNMTINADGDLKLDGTLNDMTVAGTLSVRNAELYIPDRLPASVVTLEVHEIGPRVNGEVPKAAPLATVALKIALDATRQVFVRGHGVNSEWRGHVDVGGSTAVPQLVGQLSVVTGSASLLGQSFNIDRGTIRFGGGPNIDPVLNVQASASAASIKALVNVTGTARAPKVTLTSTPMLPQDEILSRVLFESNVGSLTPSQGLQLAAAAASLAQGGPSVLDKVRTTVGLDRLDLTAGGANPKGTQGTSKGTTVTGGKYIANGVFVGVRQGLTSDSSQAEVEVEITPNISVNSTFGTASGSGFGAKYSIDY